MRRSEIDLNSIRDKGSRLDSAFHIGEEVIEAMTSKDNANFVKLGELLEYFSDGSRLELSETGIPILRLNNLDACDIHFSDLKRVSSTSGSSWTEVKAQDVLFTQAAEPFRAAVMPAGREEHTISSEITVMRPKPSIVPEYLAAILSSPSMGKILKELSYRRSAVALRRFRLQDIANIPIPLPSRELQNDIKAAYDHAARLSQESSSELAQIIEELYADIDRTTQNRIALTQFKIMKSQLAGRWDVNYCANELLKKELTKYGGVTPLLTLAKLPPSSLEGIDEDEALCVIKASNINKNTFLVESFEVSQLSELSPRMRQPVALGDVLICTTGNGDQVAYIDDKLGVEGKRILGSATFTSLRFAETPRYYAVAMSHPLVQSQLNSLGTGAIQRFISKKDLATLLIPTLSSPQRTQFDARIQSVFEKRREALNAKAEVLRLAEAFFVGAIAT